MSMLNVQATFEEIYEFAKTLLNKQSMSESDTCDKIILRVMREAAGYAYSDYVSQGHDPAGKFPDYVFLPNTEYIWYLEAKRWSTLLTDEHARQAVEYPQQHGHRWVVLTNGRVWQLYDCHLANLPPPQRCVVEVDSENIEALSEFIMALSKSSITSGGLEVYVNRVRIRSLLDLELKNPDSETIKAIQKRLNSAGLKDVNRKTITEYFSSLTRSKPIPPETTTEPKSEPVDIHNVHPSIGLAGFSLSDINQNSKYATGKKPKLVTFPNGFQENISQWKELALAIIRWLDRVGKLPSAPYKGAGRGRRWFYNTVNKHPDGNNMRAGRPVDLRDGSVIYVEANQSADNFIHNLVNLSESAGVSPASIRVTVDEVAV